MYKNEKKKSVFLYLNNVYCEIKNKPIKYFNFSNESTQFFFVVFCLRWFIYESIPNITKSLDKIPPYTCFKICRYLCVVPTYMII